MAGFPTRGSQRNKPSKLNHKWVVTSSCPSSWSSLKHRLGQWSGTVRLLLFSLMGLDKRCRIYWINWSNSEQSGDQFWSTKSIPTQRVEVSQLAKLVFDYTFSISLFILQESLSVGSEFLCITSLTLRWFLWQDVFHAIKTLDNFHRENQNTIVSFQVPNGVVQWPDSFSKWCQSH